MQTLLLTKEITTFSATPTAEVSAKAVCDILHTPLFLKHLTEDRFLFHPLASQAPRPQGQERDGTNYIFLHTTALQHRACTDFKEDYFNLHQTVTKCSCITLFLSTRFSSLACYCDSNSFGGGTGMKLLRWKASAPSPEWSHLWVCLLSFTYITAPTNCWK